MGSKHAWLLPTLGIVFLIGIGFLFIGGYPETTLGVYAQSMPILLTSGLIVWACWFSSNHWFSSRIFLLLSSTALLAIRSWLPALELGTLFYLVYYMEVLMFPMMLAALNLSEIENANRKVRALLADRVQSEKDLQFILDYSLDVILVANEAGLLLSWSKKGEEKFGYGREQAIGKIHMDDLFLSASPNRIGEELTEFHAEMERIDGSSFPVKVRVQTVMHDSRVYSIYVLQDLSKQQKMIEKQIELDRGLERAKKLESLGTLAGGIAHDFNNILMGVFGNISIAKEKLGTDHVAREFLDRAETSMTRATHLSGQLLTFAKGGAPITERIQLREVLEECVRFDLSGSNILPVIESSENLWLAEVDKGQVQQIFSNLTINAMQAMPSGGQLYFDIENIELGTVNDFALLAGKYVKVTVRDEGIGIEQKLLDQIFDPYFTTKQAGSGLGLTTTYSIVANHGGHIAVESVAGEGTTFTIYLPASDLAPSLHKGDAEKLQLSVAETVKVLVLDDEEMICDIASQMLGTMGFTVDAVATGEQAVEYYRQSMEKAEPYKLVILDLTIPGGIGGKEVAKQILALDETATVMVSSGYANDPVMANYTDYGLKGVLAKPYTFAELEKELAKTLNGAPSDEELKLSTMSA